jgi:hypothetical protein
VLNPPLTDFGRLVMKITSQPRSSASPASFAIAPGSISDKPSQKFSIAPRCFHTASACRLLSATRAACCGVSLRGASSSGGDAPTSGAPIDEASSSGNRRTAACTNG